jgi:uncharacterized membrane protein YoaT (DUF817 family)
MNITIENILSMPSESIASKVIEFCEEYDYDISEVLEVFDDKKIKELLYTDSVTHHFIKDDELKKILDKRLDTWESEKD